MIYVNFGEYIKNKRTNLGTSQRKTAQMLGISVGYLSGIERGNCSPPSCDLLDKMVELFELNSKERIQLFDLAAESKKPPTLADDLIDYIYKNSVIRDMLRYSQECQMKEKEWNMVFAFVKHNYFY